MALGQSDIRNLFFNNNTPITQVDNAILTAFIAACGSLPSTADTPAKNAANNMILGLLPASLSQNLLSALASHNMTDANILTVIAENTTLPADLSAITSNPNHNAVSDTAVINNVCTLAADLASIANRTVLATDLSTITIHSNRNAISDTAVVNNIHTFATDLIAIANRTILAVDLNNIVIPLIFVEHITLNFF